jgi:hypothetical protein
MTAMGDLEKLTHLMSENETKAARLGYALGLLHGADEDRAPEIDLQGPEMRVIEDMDLG